METERERIARLFASLMYALNRSILSSLLKARGSPLTLLALLLVIATLSALALVIVSEFLHFLSLVALHEIAR